MTSVQSRYLALSSIQQEELQVQEEREDIPKSA